MTRALARRWFPPSVSWEEAAETTRSLGLDALLVSPPTPPAGRARATLRSRGVEVCAVAPSPGPGAGDRDPGRFLEALEEAARLGEALRAPLLLVEGGNLPEPTAPRIAPLESAAREEAAGTGERAAATRLAALRSEDREAAVERAARVLHGPLRAGLPLAVRSGSGVADLLGLEETTWLLDALPGLGLWFDPARAERACRLALGPPPIAWADRLAPRTAGVLVQGLGPDLEGGVHPEEDGPDWSTLCGSLPRRVPWVLDLAPRLAVARVRDAVRYLASLHH